MLRQNSWTSAHLSRRRRSTLGFHSRDLRFETLEDRRVLAVLTVNTIADTVADDNLLSLREAISAVNAQSSAGLDAGAVDQISGTFGDNDTIQFDESLSGQTILLGGTQLVITRALTIDATALAENVIIDANQQSRIMYFTASTGDLSLSGLTLTGGRTTGDGLINGGGGIRFISNGTLALTDSTLSGNSTAGDFARGGGIYTRQGEVTLTSSTLSGNSTAGNQAYGGGIYTDSGAVTLTQSTLSGNSTAGDFARGGGIYTFSGAVTLTQSTLSGNSTAADYAVGGGISTRSGEVTLTDSTVSGNSTTGNFAPGGGIFVFNTPNDPPLTILNSIVAGNTAALGTDPDLVPDPQSTLTVNYSLIGTGISPTSGGNNVITNNPQLSPLADNGGPTMTHALLAGSPAIDAGDPAIVFHPDEFDQRGPGFPRVVNSRIDIGAYERQPVLGVNLVVVSNNLDVVNGDTSSIADLIADDGGDGISLREAILAANNTAGADTITFDASLSGQAITLSGTQLVITETLTIDATALAANVIIDANQQSRIMNFTTSTGDLSLAGLTLTGGRTTGDGSFNGGGGIRFESNGTLALTQSTLSGNSTTGNQARGGGIRTHSGAVTLTQSTLTGNSTEGNFAPGGGISSTGTGAVTLTQSTLSGNSTAEEFVHGGGIYTNLGAVTLTQSTLSGNSTAGGGALGGGIFAYSGAVTLTQSTLSGNSTAGEGANGGGILTILGAVTLTQSTLSGNSTTGANSHGGGIFVINTATNPPLTIQNSIVAGNTVAQGTAPDLVPDPDSTLTVNYSLIGVADGLTFAGDVGNLTGTAASPLDPQLDPLADNGGPTMTHALLPGSPAINAGDPDFDPDDFDPPQLYDQRGAPFARVFGGRIDIGAFEVQEAVADNADFDDDGYVDGFDFLAWQRGFGNTSATPADGDANGDGAVDGSDLEVWEQQFGTTIPMVAASSAEESTTNYQAALDAALTVSLLGASANDSEALGDEDSHVNEQQHFDSAFGSDTFLAPAEEEPDYDFTSDAEGETTSEWLAEELLEAVFG